MGRTKQEQTKADALARLQQIVRTFKIERRLEDEPAHFDKALERLAAEHPANEEESR